MQKLFLCFGTKACRDIVSKIMWSSSSESELSSHFNEFKINPIPEVYIFIQFVTTEQYKLHVEFKVNVMFS